MWQDAKTLIAWFGADANVVVGDNITLVASKIFRFVECLCRIYVMEIVLNIFFVSY